MCAWYVFDVRQRPPGLTYCDIAVHETGHVAFAPFGRLVMLAMGDGAQILFPLGLALFQLFRQRDLLTGALLLGGRARPPATRPTTSATPRSRGTR